MKRSPATGMRNAHEPIMMGNAAIGFMPSRLTRMRQGAYSPTPRVMSAPSTKLQPTASANHGPRSSSASPPAGIEPRTQHGGGDHRNQGPRIDGDRGDEDECLGDRRQRVPRVQRARNAF